MGAARFFVLFPLLLAGAGCAVHVVRPPDIYLYPRQFEVVQEGNAGKRVWVYSRGSRDLSGPLRDIEAIVGELLESTCRLTMVQRFEGGIPAHRFRLQIDQAQTSHTEDSGWGSVRYELYRVEAKMYLATNDELIATGVGRAAFSGEFRAERFSALRGLIRGIELYPQSPNALEGALHQAFTGLCYRIRQGPSADPPRSEGASPYGPPIAQAVPVYPPGWVAAREEPRPYQYHGSAVCVPPTCLESRVTAGASGSTAVGVRSGGVPLTLSGRMIKNGKIVPIKGR